MTHTPKKTATERRKEALAHVESYVCKDRPGTYGDAEDEFPKVAAILNQIMAPYLKQPLLALHVPLILIALKLARASTNPKHMDSWHDLAGYATCGAGILAAEQEKEGK